MATLQQQQDLFREGRVDLGVQAYKLGQIKTFRGVEKVWERDNRITSELAEVSQSQCSFMCHRYPHSFLALLSLRSWLAEDWDIHFCLPWRFANPRLSHPAFKESTRPWWHHFMCRRSPNLILVLELVKGCRNPFRMLFLTSW